MGTAHAEKPVLRVETWNVGLAHGFVDNAAARLPVIVEALQESDADVICLQEAWEPADRRVLRASVESAYPYKYSTKVRQHLASKAPVCKTADLFGEGRFVSCLTDSCGNTSGDAKTDCIIDKCGPALEALKSEKPECANALMAQVGKSSVAALWNVIRPLRKTGLFAYGGSDGLMLVSRRPLHNTDVIDFTDISTLNRRRAIVADVPIGDTTVAVACTHLTADLSSIAPYPGTFDGWGPENRAQVDRMLKRMKGDGPAVLMGDFNCGLDDTSLGLVGELADSCEALEAAGYEDPSRTVWPGCTWCADNTINASGDGEHTNALIDHVYIRGLVPVAGGVTYDQVVPIKVDGTAVQSSLSDHYGYQMTVALPSK
jgi:endonuclease/exonuclease/phosphatase family metal-dependent hydrolase